ncbi:MAG: 6-phosphofructokinase [Anaerolineae bacterium]|nr:MAG: 6-phosphofructokinase [Anaerolineae bacterium]
MRLGVLTGGGDVPGLNAAIRAAARRAFQYGWAVRAIQNGWAGLVDGNILPLTIKQVSGILHVGGTILGASRTNPLKDKALVQSCLDNIEEFGLGGVVVIGGEDTLGVAAKMTEMGAPVVGVPKTIDNDVAGTDYTIGFDTAVTTVAESLDRLHTTASAHHRAIVVEVMGRHAGWIAVIGGMAGGADYIFIPEVEASIKDVCEHVQRRWELGKQFSIIVVSEGAQIKELAYTDEELGSKDEFGHVRLDRRGLAETVAKEIERRTGFETRSVVLGHLQRGGSPTVFDRVLATRLGAYAIDLVKEGKFGYMAALRCNEIEAVPLSEAMAQLKTVDLELYKLAQTFF